MNAFIVHTAQGAVYNLEDDISVAIHLQVLMHEGVESRGRRQVMGKLLSICNLQASLGASCMIVDLKHAQFMQVSFSVWESCLTRTSGPLYCANNHHQSQGINPEP